MLHGAVCWFTPDRQEASNKHQQVPLWYRSSNSQLGDSIPAMDMMIHAKDDGFASQNREKNFIYVKKNYFEVYHSRAWRVSVELLSRRCICVVLVPIVCLLLLCFVVALYFVYFLFLFHRAQSSLFPELTISNHFFYSYFASTVCTHVVPVAQLNRPNDDQVLDCSCRRPDDNSLLSFCVVSAFPARHLSLSVGRALKRMKLSSLQPNTFFRIHSSCCLVHAM